MLTLCDQIASVIASKRLFAPKQSILVAVSGGVDSMVLLHLLSALAPQFEWKLTVAHLNHRLRGASSNADERLVRQVAQKLGWPVVIERADVRALAANAQISLEMAGRRLRHEFLAQAAAQLKIPAVALAHHLDDQVELFFLRLFRGSGSGALAGMKWNSCSPSNPAIRLIRPLLGSGKPALQEYAVSQRIKYRRDATNASLDIIRNRVRNELLPLLRRDYQPGLNKSIVRIMDLLGAESEFIAATAEEWLADEGASGKSARKRTSASRPGFNELPVSIQRHCLHLRLLRFGILPYYELIEHLRRFPDDPIEVGAAQLISGQGFDEAPVPSKIVRLVRKDGSILLSKPRDRVFRTGQTELFLRRTGQKKWHGVTLEWRIEAMIGQKLPPKVKGLEVFDADKVGDRVIIRHWQSGDRFQPIGMKQDVKLQDLFVNQKVAPELRRGLLVGATRGGDLFWVEGQRIAERFKLTNGTIRRLHWRWQRL